MPEDVRRNLPADLCAVRNHAHHALDGAHTHFEFVPEREVSFDEGLDSCAQGNDAAFRLRAEGPSLSIDHNPVSLPIDVFFRKACELGNAESGIEECPDDEFFFETRTRGCEAFASS